MIQLMPHSSGVVGFLIYSHCWFRLPALLKEEKKNCIISAIKVSTLGCVSGLIYVNCKNEPACISQNIPGRTKFSQLCKSAGCCFSTFRGCEILSYFGRERRRKKTCLVRRFKWHQLRWARRLPRNIVHQPLLSRTVVSSQKNKKPWKR